MTTHVDSFERPFGVTLLAILQFIAGLMGLCLPAILLVLGLGASFLGPVGGVMGILGFLIAGLLLIGPVLHFIVGFGALNLRTWAWWLGILATGVDVVGAVLNLWHGAGWLHAMGPVAFSVLVFLYLLTPSVRRAFRV
jgi:hypothetical protein